MKKHYGLLIDQERCIGCDACTVACRLEHNVAEGFIYVYTEKSDQKDVATGSFPNCQLNFVPKLCNHCENPPCIQACPVDAIYQREDNIVLIDKNQCTGCQNCLEACPYDIMEFDAEEELAQKCNFCVHRIDQGLNPFCVECCEGQAMTFGDLNNEKSKIFNLISKKETFRLNVDLGTNPSVFYARPMKRRKL